MNYRFAGLVIFTVLTFTINTSAAPAIHPSCTDAQLELLQAQYNGEESEIDIAAKSGYETTYKLIFLGEEYDYIAIHEYEQSADITENSFDLSQAPNTIISVPIGCPALDNSHTDISYENVENPPSTQTNTDNSEKTTELEETIEDKNDKINGLRDTVESLQSTVQDLKNRNEELSEEVANSSDEDRISVLEKSVLELNQTLTERNTEISRLEGRIEEKNETISDLRSRLKSSDSESEDQNQSTEQNQTQERKSLVNNIISNLF